MPGVLSLWIVNAELQLGNAAGGFCWSVASMERIGPNEVCLHWKRAALAPFQPLQAPFKVTYIRLPATVL